MAERDAEIAELKARIASLEARPATTDLDWLRNSNVFKRAELATSPAFMRLNKIIVLGGIFLIFVCPFIYMVATGK